MKPETRKRLQDECERLEDFSVYYGKLDFATLSGVLKDAAEAMKAVIAEDAETNPQEEN